MFQQFLGAFVLIAFASGIAVDDEGFLEQVKTITNNVMEKIKCTPNACHSKLVNVDCPAGNHFVRSEDCDIFTKREICCADGDQKCRKTECHSTISGSYCSKTEVEEKAEDCGFLKVEQTCCKA